jgi:hypothetical protein
LRNIYSAISYYTVWRRMSRVSKSNSARTSY